MADETAAMPGILGPGDAVVTGFSGILPAGAQAGAEPSDDGLIDPDGAAMRIMRMLPDGAAAGQVINAPTLVSVPARDVGQVFAITFDDGPAPDVYLAATSAFGIHIAAPTGDGSLRHVSQGGPGVQFMPGQWGTRKGGAAGSIYKVDGQSGVVTLFSSIGTNAGPGLGDVVFDHASRSFFVSDLDNGLIYRLDTTGLVSGTFDHGVAARPARGLPGIADDGSRMDIANPEFNSEDPATWGLTQTERRVTGLAVHGGRLYYAVADGPQLWSVGIGLDGSFRDDPRWELDVAAPASSDPVTDIVFDRQGRAILAQRGQQRGSFDDSSFAEPKTASVLRYGREVPDDPATPGGWAPVADDYAIGFPPEQRNGDGGVALGLGYDGRGALRIGSCNAFLWATGEALRDDAALAARLSPGGPASVDGLQGNDVSLVRPANVPPFSSFFADFDGNFDHPERQGWMGDVEIFQPCTGSRQGALGGPSAPPPQGAAPPAGMPPAYVPPAYLPPAYIPPGYVPPGDAPPGFLPPGSVPPSGAFNLALEKQATPEVCMAGGLGWLCTFTIRVTNAGDVPYWGPVSVRDWAPAAAPGAVMSFAAQPPWMCAETGPAEYQCDLAGVMLQPGDSVDLTVRVERPAGVVPAGGPIGEGQCFAGNAARLAWWNGPGDANPLDDMDFAEAQVPDANCLPQGEGGTNLTIQKQVANDPCIQDGRNWTCVFVVTVTNSGPGIYNGPISLSETPSVDGIIAYGPQPNPPGWSCVSTGAGGHDCSLAPVTLNPGESVPLWLVVQVPVQAQADAGRCSIENRVRITDAPGGSPGNLNAGDDEASVEAGTPGPNCEQPAGGRSDLSLTNELQGCMAFESDVYDFSCGYQVLVKNEGPNPFVGTVTIHDEPTPDPSQAGYGWPWTCVAAANGADCSLDFAAMPLAPGDSYPLNMAVDVPPNLCEVGNQARIIAPAAGSDANSDGANDTTAVIPQRVPAPECDLPQAEGANLLIANAGTGCEPNGGNPPTSVTCGLLVTIANDGPADVSAPIVFQERFGVDGRSGINNVPFDWECGGALAAIECRLLAGSLRAGSTVVFSIMFQTSVETMRANNCGMSTQASLLQPLGPPSNDLADDDVSETWSNAPPELCVAAQQLRSNVCPAERQKPDQGCCPEGETWSGSTCSRSATSPTPPPKTCPPGKTGTYPDCHSKPPKLCPPDSVGTYPKCVCPRGTTGSPGNCRKKQCATGTHGTWPNCKPDVCPAGTHGTWPKCKPDVCPAGTHGTWPKCKPDVCPAGTHGTWPKCKPDVCPAGTHGTWPKCKPNVCPPGTSGIWPNCKKPDPLCPYGTHGKWPRCADNVCPKGTFGKWPDCYKPGGDGKCPEGTAGTDPDCKQTGSGGTPGNSGNTGNARPKCTEGYVYSKKKKTCVKDKSKTP